MKRPKSNFYLFLSTQTDGIFSTFDAYRKHLQSQNRQKTTFVSFFLPLSKIFHNRNIVWNAVHQTDKIQSQDYILTIQCVRFAKNVGNGMDIQMQ